MEIYIRDINREFCDCVQELLDGEFATSTNVIVQHGSLFSSSVDAIVSPANSFGYMDGGVDKVISETLGWDLSKKLQEKIRVFTEFNEILVGDALVVQTGNEDYPNLISAPTMRLPAKINDIVDVYLASRAAVYTALVYGFSSIAMTGMGTGVGAVPYDRAAHTMLTGIAGAYLNWNRNRNE